MESRDGRYVLTYNGEIFNYLELREQLRRRGHSFRTESDTEVLLNALIEWGEDACARLEGMWAFALLDRSTDRLLCSRDRFGVKPFYYAELSDGTLVFASEIKAILAAYPSLRQPNFGLLSAFLRRSRHSEGRRTFFEQVNRLLPGENLIEDGQGRRQVTQYYDYPSRDRALRDITPEEAGVELRSRLSGSVRRRLRSDVPVGLLLSGGLDSTAIAHVAAEAASQLHCYTASWPGQPFDESGEAAKTARALGFQLHAIEFQREAFLNTLADCVLHMDAPSDSPAILPLWAMSAAMKGNIVVCLDGQGADELLGGYTDSMALPMMAQEWKLNGPLSALAAARDHARTWGVKDTVKWTIRRAAPQLTPVYRWYRGDEQIYVGALRGATAESLATDGRRQGESLLDSLLRQQHSQGLRGILQYTDAITMAHSVEARTPFLDHTLVEWAMSLPGHIKVRRALGKAVLRDAMANDLRQETLNTTRKIGFRTPVSQWFREDMDQLVRPVLDTSACRGRGLFEPRALTAALVRHEAGTTDLAPQIFRWVTMELWFQRFIDAPT